MIDHEATVRALRDAAKREDAYIQDSRAKGVPISEAIHLSIANALERVAFNLEQFDRGAGQ